VYADRVVEGYGGTDRRALKHGLSERHGPLDGGGLPFLSLDHPTIFGYGAGGGLGGEGLGRGRGGRGIRGLGDGG
jgi:hypothetical protein